MDQFENNELRQEQGFSPAPAEPVQQPPAPEMPLEPAAQPVSGTYRGVGAGRKESPYANSPYVMQRPPVQPVPEAAPVKAPKPPKKARKKTGIWKRLLAATLTVLLVAGGCAVTAITVNSQWEARVSQLENSFTTQISQLQTEIAESEKRQTILSGSAVASGDSLTPSQVYAANVDSVVAVTCTYTTSYYGQTAEGTSSGSGFILSSDGYVVTNCHVVEGANAVSVITHNGEEHTAQIIGSDSSNDVAVLKIDAAGLPAVTLGSSNDLAIGDMVVAIGNPLGTLSSTQTVGYVSGKERDVTTDGTMISMIQTDAAINSGNSGGPLFNMNGEVVGITTAKYSGTTSSGASIEGIGFAIPIDDITTILSDLVDYGYVTGAYLGVMVQNSDDLSASQFGLPSGAYVVSVEPDYCAAEAGIRAKDIIVDLGGYKVTGITSLTRALRNFKAGDTTTVTVIRGGKELTLDITLDDKPQAADTTVPSDDPAMPSEGDPDEWYDYYYRRFFGE